MWSQHLCGPSIYVNRDSLEGQLVRNLPAMQETTARFLGWKDPLEEDMVTHSSILAWRIPTDREAWWIGYSLVSYMALVLRLSFTASLEISFTFLLSFLDFMLHLSSLSGTYCLVTSSDMIFWRYVCWDFLISKISLFCHHRSW